MNKTKLAEIRAHLKTEVLDVFKTDSELLDVFEKRLAASHSWLRALELYNVPGYKRLSWSEWRLIDELQGLYICSDECRELIYEQHLVLNKHCKLSDFSTASWYDNYVSVFKKKHPDSKAE
jgi:hypothetical protein